MQDQCELLTTSAFLWGKRDLAKGEFGRRQGEDEESDGQVLPWLVFCSPPYAFYVERQDEMLGLISAILEHCPPESILLVEADERFDFSLLPGGVRTEKRGPGWDVRTYPPAVVGVWRT